MFIFRDQILPQSDRVTFLAPPFIGNDFDEKIDLIESGHVIEKFKYAYAQQPWIRRGGGFSVQGLSRHVGIAWVILIYFSLVRLHFSYTYPLSGGTYSSYTS